MSQITFKPLNLLKMTNYLGKDGRKISAIRRNEKTCQNCEIVLMINPKLIQNCSYGRSGLGVGAYYPF